MLKAEVSEKQESKIPILAFDHLFDSCGDDSRIWEETFFVEMEEHEMKISVAIDTTSGCISSHVVEKKGADEDSSSWPLLVDVRQESCQSHARAAELLFELAVAYAKMDKPTLVSSRPQMVARADAEAENNKPIKTQSQKEEKDKKETGKADKVTKGGGHNGQS